VGEMSDLPNAMASYRAQRLALISGAQNKLIDTISTAIDKACIEISSDESDIEYKDYFMRYILIAIFDRYCNAFDNENNKGEFDKAMNIIDQFYCKIYRWNITNRDTYD
jgi:hypothetical protein